MTVFLDRQMKKVAVFGNTGGGKSTLSKRLSEITNLPLYILDKVQYQPGGTKVPDDEYKRIHKQIIATDQWIIDGFGYLETDRNVFSVFCEFFLTFFYWLKLKLGQFLGQN